MKHTDLTAIRRQETINCIKSGMNQAVISAFTPEYQRARQSNHFVNANNMAMVDISKKEMTLPATVQRVSKFGIYRGF